MKKFLLMVMLIIIISILVVGVVAFDGESSVQPQMDNVASVICELVFDSTKRASVYAKVIGYSGSSSISGTLVLYQGEGENLTYLTSWLLSGTQYILFNDNSYQCESGTTYTLTLNVTVERNGVYEIVSFSDSSVCP